jgi:hypothetical protein|uniref:Uncharacterized protein n=1 Tax=Zea mays TaxID=4577 RepID=C0PA09_MAIZE|nr:unknown [Zea mays]
MARIKDDPSLKPILDEIDNGRPSAMVKCCYCCLLLLSMRSVWNMHRTCGEHE